MYGTVARLKIREDAIEEAKRLGGDDRQPDGGVAAYVLQSDDDPQEFFLIAVFEDEASYRANSQAPETQENFQRLAQLLAAEPQWHDGQYVMANSYR